MANHCQICGVECSECQRRRKAKADQVCACGCGVALTGKRWHARYATELCRYRARNRRRQQRASMAE